MDDEDEAAAIAEMQSVLGHSAEGDCWISRANLFQKLRDKAPTAYRIVTARDASAYTSLADQYCRVAIANGDFDDSLDRNEDLLEKAFGSVLKRTFSKDGKHCRKTGAQRRGLGWVNLYDLELAKQRAQKKKKSTLRTANRRAVSPVRRSVRTPERVAEAVAPHAAAATEVGGDAETTVARDAVARGPRSSLERGARAILILMVMGPIAFILLRTPSPGHTAPILSASTPAPLPPSTPLSSSPPSSESPSPSPPFQPPVPPPSLLPISAPPTLISSAPPSSETHSPPDSATNTTPPETVPRPDAGTDGSHEASRGSDTGEASRGSDNGGANSDPPETIERSTFVDNLRYYPRLIRRGFDSAYNIGYEWCRWFAIWAARVGGFLFIAVVCGVVVIAWVGGSLFIAAAHAIPYWFLDIWYWRPCRTTSKNATHSFRTLPP